MRPIFFEKPRNVPGERVSIGQSGEIRLRAASFSTFAPIPGFPPFVSRLAWTILRGVTTEDFWEFQQVVPLVASFEYRLDKGEDLSSGRTAYQVVRLEERVFGFYCAWHRGYLYRDAAAQRIIEAFRIEGN